MSTGNGNIKRVGSTAQRLAEKPYEERMCRIETYPSCVSWRATYEGPSVEEWVDLIDEMGMEVQIVDGEINRGTPRFPSEMIEPHAGVANERLPRFLELAHERGIIVLSYYPIIYTKPLKPLHPEWLMKFLDDGRPEPENLGWFCFNSPYRDWLPQYLIEWMDNLDIDGLYFDDTNYGTHEDRPWTPSCCCSFCEELFRQETGEEIPRKVDFDSMTFRRFINWRYEKMIDFMHHLFSTIRAKHPDAILDLNSYIRPQNDWSDGHPLGSLRLEEVGGYFFVETFHSLREPGFVAKALRATGTPFGIFRNVAQNLKGFGCPPYPEPYAAAISGLGAMINGGAPCGGPLGQCTLLQKEATTQVFSDYKKRAPYVAGETLKHVALHYSQMNRDFRPSEIPKNTNQVHFHQIGQVDQYGAYEMLNRSHVVFDMVLDEHLAFENLAEYGILFLSNSACLSDAHCDAIRRFVEEGGTLIATHQTSLLDEWGQSRGQFALADVLGVEYRGPRGAEEKHPVIYVPHDDGIASRFGHVICFYAGESSIAVDAESEVLCTGSKVHEPEFCIGHFDSSTEFLGNFHPSMDYDSSEPAVTVHSYGKGQAIYIAGDVGSAYMNSPYPVLRRFVAHLVGRTPAPIAVEAPEVIEMTAAYRPSGELMIHLLNNPVGVVPWKIEGTREDYDETQGLFHAPFEVNPIHDILIRFNELKPLSARLPLQDVDLEISGDAAIVVPRVDLHEVVCVGVTS